jgi:hypothetical protein
MLARRKKHLRKKERRYLLFHGLILRNIANPFCQAKVDDADGREPAEKPAPKKRKAPAKKAKKEESESELATGLDDDEEEALSTADEKPASKKVKKQVRVCAPHLEHGAKY